MTTEPTQAEPPADPLTDAARAAAIEDAEQLAAQGNKPTVGTIPNTANVSSGVVPGPDGKPLISLDIGYGFTAVRLIMTEAMAVNIGPGIQQSLAAAIADLHRIQSGIMLPSEAAAAGLQLPGLPGSPQNGGRPGHGLPPGR